MATKTIVLPKPHALQLPIEEDPHRFRVVACGRRWGKTFMCMREAFNMLVRGYIKTNVKQRGWVVAPTFPLVREDWMLAEVILKDAITDKKQTDMRMDFGPIGFLEFKSAEREDEGLRGAGLNCAVLDEASRITRKSWEQGIRPALADKLGRCIFISTPKGRNWFYELYQRGQKLNTEIKSWKHPTFSNPYFPESEWQTIVDTTPEMIRKQEYEADFLEDEASVFKNIHTCFRGELEQPKDREFYTIGVDLGKSEDFTVITVIKNSSRQVVHLQRFNKIDWSLQKKQILATFFRYTPSVVWIDSTGLGDPIEEDLRHNGVITRDYKFNNSSKQELVEQLVVAIEQGLIGIPDVPELKVLIEELKAYTYEVLPSGRMRYNAPEGLHDDCVISLGLAVIGISHLLHNRPAIKKEPSKVVTADMEEKHYKNIKRIKGCNPYMSDAQAKNLWASRKLNRMMIHG